MASRSARNCARPRKVGLGATLALAATWAWAQPGIYTCVDASGKRITSDRPIAQCMDREQSELRSDGTVKRVVKPPLTPEERARIDAAERQRAEERARLDEQIRRDKTLMQRYPNEAAHRAVRNKELSDANETISLARKRLVDLDAERKTLNTEAEFYKKGGMPAQLKRRLDENNISINGANRTIATQQAEINKINERFDSELTRLKRLWAGDAPGATGSAPVNTATK